MTAYFIQTSMELRGCRACPVYCPGIAVLFIARTLPSCVARILPSCVLPEHFRPVYCPDIAALCIARKLSFCILLGRFRLMRCLNVALTRETRPLHITQFERSTLTKCSFLRVLFMLGFRNLNDGFIPGRALTL